MKASTWLRPIAFGAAFGLLATAPVGALAQQPRLSAALLASAPPIPPGQGRVWFYRDFFAGDTPDIPAVSMNGTLVGYGRRGVSFYRNVPTGGFHITCTSQGIDVNQSANVDVAAGEIVFVKIESAPNWDDDEGEFNLGTYYVRQIAPSLADAELANTKFVGGS